MTEEERKDRDWPEGWMKQTTDAVRVAETVTQEMVDHAWVAFHASAGAKGHSKMRAALEAAALTARTDGEIHALRALADDLETSGLGDDIGEGGMAAFIRARADRLETSRDSDQSR